MVGVPGKYKGCETCRRRRVKCSNERPLCKSCTNSGRQCEGYQRQRVFITGTLESKGRVASHPKKSASVAAGKKARCKPQGGDKSSGDDIPVLLSALQTTTTSIPDAVMPEVEAQPREFPLDSQLHVPVDVHHAHFDFNADPSSPCMPSLGSSDDGTCSGDAYCALWYHQGHSPARMDLDLGPDPWHKMDAGKRRPPNSSSFPNHQYIASIALLHRCEAYSSSPDWPSASRAPQESQLDRFFDLALQLPAIFTQADRLLASPATTARRVELHDTLGDCLALQGRFSQWLAQLSVASAHGLPALWVHPTDGLMGEMPFENPFTFRDSQTGLVMMYYWMSQILFRRCMASVHAALFHPVIDTYPDMGLGLPSTLQMDIGLYQDCHQMAANICRGLDAVLGMSVQPDMLDAPMMVVADYYREVGARSQDCLLELMWLESFKNRHAARRQHITNAVLGQPWTEIVGF